nr:hypothetical protein [Halobaculum sp. DT92]
MALLALQVVGLAAALLLAPAIRALRRLLGPDRYRAPPVAEAAALRVRDVPRWYWVALLVQVVVVPGLGDPLGGTLYRVPVVGDAVRLLLDGGLLAGAGLLVALGLAAVVAAGRTQRVVVDLAGEDPGAALGAVAPAALGVAVLVVSAAVAAAGVPGPVVPGVGASLAYSSWLLVVAAPVGLFSLMRVAATLTGDPAFEGCSPTAAPASRSRPPRPSGARSPPASATRRRRPCSRASRWRSSRGAPASGRPASARSRAAGPTPRPWSTPASSASSPSASSRCSRCRPWRTSGRRCRSRPPGRSWRCCSCSWRCSR